MTKAAPVTTAVRLLREKGVAFTEHPYDFVEHGGTGEFARQAGVDEHAVVKTLVFEDEAGRPLLVLMHGDREVSAKELARTLGTKAARPAPPADAERHTGYKVGGISPFGTRKPLAVYVEAGILDLPRIFINGGKRGFLVGIDPRELVRVLAAKPVRVAIEK